MRLNWGRCWGPAAVFLAGIGVAAGVAAAIGMPTKDAAKVLIESALGAAAAGVVAALLLLVLRRASVTVQATIAALAPVAAVAIGISWAASEMFLMQQDLRILWVVLVSAGAAGLAAALILGRTVADTSRSVGAMARRLGEDGPVALSQSHPGHPGHLSPGPGELTALAAELHLSSNRLAEAQLRAEATERSRRELVAWVSHDLRTPLAGIRAMIEALEDGVVSDRPTVERYYATIRLEADRLAGLVDDLFELSRIQSGALALVQAPVALDEVLSEAVDGAAIAARAKGVVLHSQVQDPAPVVDLAPPEMIRVIRNLLDNAIRHTRPGGTVTLTGGCDQAGSAVLVSVLDQCGGIDAGDLDRVFEMGYRGDEARTPGEGRGGLGLAVAKGLVQAHAGQISVDNEAGGCRFTVQLPVHRRGQVMSAD